MPVSYTIDGPGGLIHTRCVGDVTLDEVVGHFDELMRDPACPARLDVYLDFTELDSIPASSQLRVVTRKMEDVAPRVSFGRCAIVAPTDVIYGMTRVFVTLAEHQFAAARVFRGAAEAWSWLNAGR